MAKIKIILAAVVLIALTIGATLFASGSFKKTNTSVFVDQVQSMATLATAKAQIKVVKEENINNLFGIKLPVNLPGTQRNTLLVIPATVIAGVDLEQLVADDIEFNKKTNELKIQLPHATFLQPPAIDLKEVKFVSAEGLLSAEFPAEEVLNLAEIAQEDIEKEAKKMDLLKTAEENAVVALTNFFSHLDYKVTVTFE